jgi:hypothetical protein
MLKVLIFVRVKPKLKWKGTIKMDLKNKVGNLRWIYLRGSGLKGRVVVRTITYIVFSVKCEGFWDSLVSCLCVN